MISSTIVFIQEGELTIGLSRVVLAGFYIVENFLRVSLYK
jgi:hypothetical protein